MRVMRATSFTSWPLRARRVVSSCRCDSCRLTRRTLLCLALLLLREPARLLGVVARCRANDAVNLAADPVCRPLDVLLRLCHLVLGVALCRLLAACLREARRADGVADRLLDRANRVVVVAGRLVACRVMRAERGHADEGEERVGEERSTRVGRGGGSDEKYGDQQRAA